MCFWTETSVHFCKLLWIGSSAKCCKCAGHKSHGDSQEASTADLNVSDHSVVQRICWGNQSIVHHTAGKPAADFRPDPSQTLTPPHPVHGKSSNTQRILLSPWLHKSAQNMGDHPANPAPPFLHHTSTTAFLPALVYKYTFPYYH